MNAPIVNRTATPCTSSSASAAAASVAPAARMTDSWNRLTAIARRGNPIAWSAANSRTRPATAAYIVFTAPHPPATATSPTRSHASVRIGA